MSAAVSASDLCRDCGQPLDLVPIVVGDDEPPIVFEVHCPHCGATERPAVAERPEMMVEGV